MAGSEIARVSNNAQSLYKLLGFNDKNQNGIIEKDSDENYKEDADINKDRKIVEAEARFYLKSMKNIDPKVKQRFSLTEADREVLFSLFKEALEMAEITERTDDKAKIIKKISSNVVEAALDEQKASRIFRAALGITKTMEDPQFKAETILYVVSKMAKAKLFKEALETARAIENIEDKVNSIVNIASEMANAGWDKNEVCKIFQEAMGLANAIEYTENKARTIKFIASKIVEAGIKLPK